MSRMLQFIPLCFQRLPFTVGSSTRHTRDMELVSRTKSKPAKSRRSLDDIVDDIVLELGDARGQCFRLAEDETRAKVRHAIEDSTKFFDRWDSSFSRRGRAAIAKDAQELAGLIAAL